MKVTVKDFKVKVGEVEITMGEISTEVSSFDLPIVMKEWNSEMELMLKAFSNPCMTAQEKSQEDDEFIKNMPF